MGDAFEVAVARVLRFEGGYTDDSAIGDRGGATNHGISERAYPGLNIGALTREQAMALYRSDYWDRPRIGELPDRIAIAVLDAAVNSGPSAAIRWLQAALGVAQDGIIGDQTLTAARAAEDVSRVLMRFNGARLRFLTGISSWPSFGRGWSRRVADNLMEV